MPGPTGARALRAQLQGPAETGAATGRTFAQGGGVNPHALPRVQRQLTSLSEPASLITLAHFAVSAAMKSRNCSGVFPAVVRPCSASFSFTRGIGHRGGGDPVQGGDDRRRRRSRRDHAVPVLDPQFRHAELRRGRHIGRRRRARAGAERDRLQWPPLTCGRMDRQVEERHLYLLAEQVVHGGRRAAIGHVHDVDAGGQLEQFAGQMRQAAGAGGGEIEFSGLRLCERDQLGHVPRRHVARDHQHFRHGRDQRHRREILQRLVGTFSMLGLMASAPRLTMPIV